MQERVCVDAVVLLQDSTDDIGRPVQWNDRWPRGLSVAESVDIADVVTDVQ